MSEMSAGTISVYAFKVSPEDLQMQRSSEMFG